MGSDGPVARLPKGPEQIASMARSFRPSNGLSSDFVVNPVVDVDGDTACGTFRKVLFRRSRHRREDNLSWNMGLYRLPAVRTADGWRMKRLDWESMTTTTPFDPVNLLRD